MQQRKRQGFHRIEQLYFRPHYTRIRKAEELTFESALITPKTILKRVFGKDETVQTLLGTVKEEISSMEKVVDIDYSPATINLIRMSRKELEKQTPLQNSDKPVN